MIIKIDNVEVEVNDTSTPFSITKVYDGFKDIDKDNILFINNKIKVLEMNGKKFNNMVLLTTNVLYDIMYGSVSVTWVLRKPTVEEELLVQVTELQEVLAMLFDEQMADNELEGELEGEGE